MANIYIIDDIKLNHRGLQTKDEKGSWVDLHCQQGRLDGACVVYSTIMALLCLDFLSEEDIDIWKKKNPDRRTLKGKLLSHLLDEQGLIRDGYYLKDMASELKAALRNYKVNHIVKQDCIFDAKEYNMKVKRAMRSFLNFFVLILVTISRNLRTGIVS